MSGQMANRACLPAGAEKGTAVADCACQTGRVKGFLVKGFLFL
jgi:hypothetical protein